jgi:hypothetical protein
MKGDRFIGLVVKVIFPFYIILIAVTDLSTAFIQFSGHAARSHAMAQVRNLRYGYII